MGYSCRTLLRDTLLRHCCGTLLCYSLPAPQILRVLKLYYKVASSQLPAPDTPRTTVVLLSFQLHRLLRVLKLYYQVTSSHLPAPQIPRVLKLYHKVASARLHFARSTRTISAEGCAGTGQIALSPAFRALDTHDLRRGLRAHGTNRTLACISRTRHARSPQRVARAWDKSHSRLHFAHSTRTISAEGNARMGQIALSPAFRTLDTRDLRRGLRVKSPKRAFRTRLPQKLTRQSLQNERFVRDFLQKSSGNTHRSTHITQPCQAVSRFQPLQTTSAHTPIPMGQRHSPLPQLTTSRFPAPATNLSPSTRLTRTKVLRLPRNVTSLTPRNLAIPCACHENRTSRSPAPATKSDNIITCELQQNLHHTTRLE